MCKSIYVTAHYLCYILVHVSYVTYKDPESTKYRGGENLIDMQIKYSSRQARKTYA